MRYINYKDNQISKLSLGTVQFGLDYGINNQVGKPSQESVNEIIRFVIKSGINCFDTAQAYGNSEEVLGNALNGDDILLISKCKSNVFKEDVVVKLKESLENLKVKSLFSLLLHDSELLYSWKEEYTQKVKLLKESKINLFFGVSIYSAEEFDMAIENENINFIQIPFSLFDQRAITQGWFNKARKANKLVFIRSVYLQGLLLMDKESVLNKLPIAVEYINKLDNLCEEYKLSRNELSLSFVDSMAKESLLLFGCDTLDQARENIDTYNKLVPLTTQQTQRIIELFSEVSENIYNPTKW